MVRDKERVVVMKFGGASVADAESIKRVAARIVAAKRAGGGVLAVLSAPRRTAGDLIAMANEIARRPNPREMDMLLSIGERQACALAAMAINDRGYRALSLTGPQAGIVTNTAHTKARILDVRADRIHAALDAGQIVLVAGFQGMSTEADITTLGRGGSDLTAVALAAALDAEVCDVYTDVPGIFTADPRIVPGARRLPVVSFDEMLEMSASGAKVLHLRAVEYARAHGVRIHCRSSFEAGPGTWVLHGATARRPLVTAVAHSLDDARIDLTGAAGCPGMAAGVMRAMTEASVEVDSIAHDQPSMRGRARMSFVVRNDDLDVAVAALEAVRKELGIGAIAAEAQVGTVSLIGAGMRSPAGVVAKALTTLGDRGASLRTVVASPLRLSCVVRESEVGEAVRALHAAFALGAPPGGDMISETLPRGPAVGAGCGPTAEV